MNRDVSTFGDRGLSEAHDSQVENYCPTVALKDRASLYRLGWP